MTPDQIKHYLDNTFDTLVARQRTSPDGWAFFLGTPEPSATSNRILRAVRYTPYGPTKLKLSVSSRMHGTNEEIDFNADEEALRSMVDHEIALFREHYSR